MYELRFELEKFKAYVTPLSHTDRYIIYNIYPEFKKIRFKTKPEICEKMPDNTRCDP
ncbi:unnamed protein product [marine sediment metagenome]|uniref:Uncharacterized protein n=1 Tax=marine sediment metagenome TaxID=412755 RepID=X1CZP2_9ZZZZ